MKIKKLELETVCGITSSLPRSDLTEIAFWGRSNVGKSSLLNALWGRKAMARTSSEPGKTQTINYYRVEFSFKLNDDIADKDDEIKQGITSEEAALYMIDLPGYGYAKTSRETVAKWMTMIDKYLTTSEALRGVFLLIDARHAPTDRDIEQFAKLFNLGFNPIIVATKVDKLKKNEKKKQIKAIKKRMTDEAVKLCEAAGDTVAEDFEIPVIGFSSVTGEGKEELSQYVQFFAGTSRF